jgi:hypothetical protein
VPVSQRAPQPFEWAKLEITEPKQTENDIANPHTDYDVDFLVVLLTAIKLPRSPLEKELAGQAGKDVVA